MRSARSPEIFHPFYRALIDLRIPILPLDPTTKRPAFGKVASSIISSADEACDLREKGFNLGMVCHLDPRALVEMSRLLKPSAPMLKIDKDTPSRRAKAMAHLRSVQARLKPSDDPMEVLKTTAADLVVGFQYDPVEATSLLYAPLGRSKSSRNFRTAVLRLPGPIFTLGIDEIGRVMEDAVDEVSPMAATAWKIRYALEQVTSLLEVMEGLPPKAEQAEMTATDLRRVACDLLGIDQELINPKVFGHLIHKAIQEGRIPLRPGRISHPVYGDQRIYHGVNETFLRECWLWRKNK